ncbi:MAG: hypothetical protein WC996_04585, partial [Peptostreptococcales bacterium]
MKKLSTTLCMILTILLLPVNSFAAVIIGDTDQDLPIYFMMEDATDFETNNNAVITSGAIEVGQTQDCVEGEYALEVVMKDITDESSGEYILDKVDSGKPMFNIQNYSQIKLWIKPGFG